MNGPLPADFTLDELRPHLAEAMLPHVPFEGWGWAAARAAEVDLGLAEGTARLVFPGGAVDMIDAWIVRADQKMAEACDTPEFRALKVREKVTTAIRTRLEQATPHREALRRATAILASPENWLKAPRLSWRTADSIWRLAGDRATDFNHYSKRALAAGVYSSTLLYWLNDDSEGAADSWAFLDRRIADIMQIEKVKAKLAPSEATDRLSLARFLGRLRYPVDG